MLTIIVGAILPAIVVLIIGIRLKLRGGTIGKNKIEDLLLTSFVLGMVGACLGLIVAIALTTVADTNYVQVKTVPLVAMKDKQIISGSFFLGSGYIGSKLVYRYMAEEETNLEGKAYRAGQVDANRIRVIETDMEQPKLIYANKVISNPKLRLWALSPGSKYPKLFYIVVPVGSIVDRNYIIDLD